MRRTFNENDTTEMKITSSLLYGVFVSERSYLAGVRALTLRKHADMLADRSTSHRLPQELIDMVAEYIVESSRTVEETNSQDKEKLNQGIYDCPAHRAAREKINSFGVIITRIRNDAPITRRTPRAGESAPHYYMHLSATKPRPALAWSLPFGPPRRFNDGSVIYMGNGWSSRAIVSPNHDDDEEQKLNEDDLRYTSGPPDEDDEGYHDYGGPRIARLLHCNEAEEAMQNWDAEAVRKFAELLDLKLIPFDEGDPMKPGLHVWQRISEP